MHAHGDWPISLDRSTLRWVTIAPNRSSSPTAIPSSPGTRPRWMNASGRIKPLATRIPVKVPPATTVAPSPRRALSAIASSMVAGECQSGSSTGQLLLEILHRLGQHRVGDLPGLWVVNALDGVIEPRPRLFGGCTSFGHPSRYGSRHRFEEAQRVGGLYDVGFMPPAFLVGEDEPHNLADLGLGQARVSQEIPHDPCRSLGVGDVVERVVPAAIRLPFWAALGKRSLHVVAERGDLHLLRSGRLELHRPGQRLFEMRRLWRALADPAPDGFDHAVTGRDCNR